MAIFNSYVKLPEGKGGGRQVCHQWHSDANGFSDEDAGAAAAAAAEAKGRR